MLAELLGQVHFFLARLRLRAEEEMPTHVELNEELTRLKNRLDECWNHYAEMDRLLRIDPRPEGKASQQMLIIRSEASNLKMRIDQLMIFMDKRREAKLFAAQNRTCAGAPDPDPNPGGSSTKMTYGSTPSPSQRRRMLAEPAQNSGAFRTPYSVSSGSHSSGQYGSPGEPYDHMDRGGAGRSHNVVVGTPQSTYTWSATDTPGTPATTVSAYSNYSSTSGSIYFNNHGFLR